MIGIRFRFPAGAYHATPWQRHVNEAEVEWPPSPWRIARSLIAVWYRKAVYERFREETLRELVTALSACLPEYALPTGVHTNSRHYMPISNGKTTLVFDAFVRVDKLSYVVVTWREVHLTADQHELLLVLVENLGYLGRAESWVEATVTSGTDVSVNCVPIDQPDAIGGEQSLVSDANAEFVKVLAPMTPAAYASWRNSQMAEAGDGRSSPSRGRRGTMPEVFAADIFGALLVDTNDMERVGRVHPAGARWVGYRRAALTPSAPDRVPAIRRSYPVCNAARFALVSKPAPSILETVDLADVFHMALLKKCGEDAPAIASGREADGTLSTRGHRHLFILPEDADYDGYLEHITVYSADPFPLSVMEALPKLTSLSSPRWWAGPHRQWALYLENVFLADASVSANATLPLLLQSSTTWISGTPYLHPWHQKKNGKFGPGEQIGRELALRGLPQAAALQEVESITRRQRRYEKHQFRRDRRSKQQNLPDTSGSLWRLDFPEAVRGPIALGSHCHFGLGLFVPIESAAPERTQESQA